MLVNHNYTDNLMWIFSPSSVAKKKENPHQLLITSFCVGKYSECIKLRQAAKKN